MIARVFQILILTLLLVCVPLAGFAAPVTSTLAPGLNVTGVTAAQVAGQATAFSLLTSWKPTGVIAIEAYEATSGKLLRAELDGGGNPAGSNFPLVENSALYVYSSQAGTLDLGDSVSCTPLNLTAGFNLAGYACFPPNYKASAFITSIGLANITSLSRIDLPSGRWQTAAVDGGVLVGDDFPLVAGEGYLVSMVSLLAAWMPSTFSLVPDNITVRQGETGAVLELRLSTPAPAGGISAQLASNNPALLTVPASIDIAEGASVASIPLTPLLTNSFDNISVTVATTNTDIGKGSATVQIRPAVPTVNLSPLTASFAASEFFNIIVALTDPAPAGGLTVTLGAVPAGNFQVPATVTIPAGALTAKVWAKGTAPGNYTVTASAPGFLSGHASDLTIVPCITTEYGPVISSSVGVMVPTTAQPTSETYSPITSLPLGIAVGPVITGVSPNHGAIGDSGLLVRVEGRNLSAATGLSFLPADGITVRDGSFLAASDGTYVQVVVDIAENASITSRTIFLAGVTALPAAPYANIFNVTLKLPVIDSITPITKEVGTTFTLTLRGRNFAQASAVQFVPNSGVLINNPPTISADGSIATVTVILLPQAMPGQRSVTITTPAGTSSDLLSARNSFTITALPGEEFTPLISQAVGVMVPPTQSPTSETYTPIMSLPVGIAVGPVITAVNPNHGAIGDSGVVVRVEGRDLAAATGLSFLPADGISIRDGSFMAAVDGTYAQATIDIAENAATTLRTVQLSGVSALPAAPYANTFRVTLKIPVLESITPITRERGVTFSLTLRGRNFGEASAVNFTPADGVLVNNPPAVSADGSVATVTVILSPSAALGQRAVTITAPGGTSPVELSARNTFTITAGPGEEFTPLISQAVGVMVPVTAANQSNNYGPIFASGVGVLVTPEPPPPLVEPFTPLQSLPVGVAVGGAITGMAPKTMEPGTTATITVSGAGLDAVTGVTLLPGDDTAVTGFTPAADGRSMDFTVTAAPDASRGRRTLVLQTAAGVVLPAAAGANIFLVGPKPQIAWIDPILKSANSVFELTISGVNFHEADRVSFVGLGGILANNPPAVSADGTSATVKVIIDGGAPCGQRGVVISSPYGSSDAVLTAKNTFTICEGAALPP